MTAHDELVERVARAMIIALKSDEALYVFAYDHKGASAKVDGWVAVPEVAAAALAAVYEAIKEPTDAMFFDPDDVCVNMGQSPWEAFCKIYRTMLAASPLNPENVK